MVWKIFSIASAISAVICLVTMLILNPTCVPEPRDLPWLISFFIFTVSSPILWAHGRRDEHKEEP